MARDESYSTDDDDGCFSDCLLLDQVRLQHTQGSSALNIPERQAMMTTLLDHQLSIGAKKLFLHHVR
jgi:hypothetical protein